MTATNLSGELDRCRLLANCVRRMLGSEDAEAELLLVDIMERLGKLAERAEGEVGQYAEASSAY